MQTEPRGTPLRQQYTSAAIAAAARGEHHLLLFEPVMLASGEMVLRADVDPALARRGAAGPPPQPGPARRPTTDVVRRPTAQAAQPRMLTGSYIDPATTPPAKTPPPPRFRLEPWHKVGIVALVIFGVLSLCAFGAVRFVDALATSAGAAVGKAVPFVVIGAVIGAVILLAACTRTGRRVVRVFVEVKG